MTNVKEEIETSSQGSKEDSEEVFKEGRMVRQTLQGKIRKLIPPIPAIVDTKEGAVYQVNSTNAILSR